MTENESKRVMLMVDASYINSAAFYTGKMKGYSRGKLNYVLLLDKAKENGVLLQPVVFFNGFVNAQIPFKKFLAKNGYDIRQLDTHEDINRAIITHCKCLFNRYQNISEVIIVTGNGKVAPICRLLSNKANVKLWSFPVSTANVLLSGDYSTYDLTNLLYDAS